MKTFLTNLFSILKKILIILLKLLFCLLFTIMVGYSIALIGFGSFATKENFDWQIILYVGLGIFLIFSIWINSFFKTARKFKLICLILFIAWFFSFKILPSVMYQINEDSCVDTGICAEGLKFGKNTLTKDYCLKKHFKWDDKRKECDMAIESRTCEKQGYEWITTEGRCSHKIIKDW